MAKYRNKAVVDADRHFDDNPAPGATKTADGEWTVPDQRGLPMFVLPGDYVVIYSTGQRCIMGPSIFNLLYEPM